MQSYFATIAAVLALLFWNRPGELNQNISSITANIKIGRTVEIEKLNEPVFRNVICNFSITPTPSSPPSAVLAGKVVDNNTGNGREFVPIFFGSTLHHPRLAALTNADGEFRFRVRLSESRNGKLTFRLQAVSLEGATLYLGGKFDQNAEMISSYTHIHSLREFLERSAQKKP